MNAPLRSGGLDESKSQSDESYLISALIDSGQFTPGRYRIEDDDIIGWPKLWRFCLDYQTRAGKAPPRHLIEDRFPSFEFTKPADVGWAADRVARAAIARAQRLGIRDAVAALKDDDVDAASDLLSAIPRPRSFSKEPSSVFDHALIEETFDVSKIEVPYPTLQRATGGIGPAELWFYGARWSQGKSWLLCKQAVHAARHGYKVCLLSYEMQSNKVARRMHRIFAERDRELYKKIRSDDPIAYKEVIDEIAARTQGSVKILDTGYGRIHNVNYVAQVAPEYDLVILDHVGLMTDAQGHRASEDWRYHMSISNQLKEITLESGTPILGAIQVNREGERSGAMTPPKGSTVAGTDALGQDADVLVMHKRYCDRVMVSSTEKMREGAKVKFWSNFDIPRNLWDEISREEAMEIGSQDGDLNEDE